MAIQRNKPNLHLSVLFLVFFLVFTMNTSNNLISHLGLGPNALIAVLFAMGLTWFCSNKNLLFVFVTITLTVCANVSKISLGSTELVLNQEVLISTLVLFITLPTIINKVG